MTEKSRKLTKATKVLEQLHQDIISGHFASGEKLQMDGLKEKYGVGYSPLREALSRLVAIGLVQAEEQCGFCVSPLSLNELHDLYHIRAYIESLALELAMQHGDDQWEADVIASWHLFAKYIDPHAKQPIDLVKYEKLQKNYLFTLVSACQSPWLLKIHEMLYDQTARYRALCLSNNIQKKKIRADYIKEEEQLINAVLSRDIGKANKLCRRSLSDAAKIVADLLNKK